MHVANATWRVSIFENNSKIGLNRTEFFELFLELFGSSDAAGVGTHYNQFHSIVIHFFDFLDEIFDSDRLSLQIIDRHAEKALRLSTMKVNCHDSVCAHSLNEFRYVSGRYRHSRLHFP